MPSWPTSANWPQSATGSLSASVLSALEGVTVRWAYDPGSYPVLVGGALNGMPSQVAGNTVGGIAAIANCTYSASGGPNSKAMFTTSATAGSPNFYMKASSGTPPAPGTTPLFWYLIMRLDSVTSNEHLISALGGPRLQRFNAEQNVAAINGTLSTKLAMATSTWYRAWCKFANSTSIDELKIGSASTGVGTSFGNGGATQATGLGNSVTGTTNAANVSVAYALEASAIPSAAQILALDALFARPDVFGTAVTFG